MNKPLTTAEIDRLSVPAPTVMTKREKLLRLADVVRHSRMTFMLWNGLERCSNEMLAELAVDRRTAFGAAASDPILADAGLKPKNLFEVKQFFELTQDELHAFSCDCGGMLSNDQMASRIERIAKGPTPSMFARAKDVAGF